MIELLPEDKDIRANIESWPVFEYVKEVIENFWPEEYFDRFVTRLFDNKIINFKLSEYDDATTEKARFKHTSYMKAYDKDFEGIDRPNRLGSYSGEIASTLKAYDLDISKFWYLCLMIKDYVEGGTQKGCMINTTTHRSEIIKFISQLDFLKSEDFSSFSMPPKDLEIELCLKIRKKSNKNAKNLSITSNVHTLLLIQEALNSFLNSNSKRSLKMDCPVIDVKSFNFLKEDKSPHVKIALFYHYLIWFLNKRAVNKEYVSNSKFFISTSKNLLISRMAYYSGLTDNENFLIMDGDYLRSYISGYEDTIIDTLNAHYDMPENGQSFIDVFHKIVGD